MRKLRSSVLVAAALLTCTGVAAATAADAPAPLPQPATGCSTFTDPVGDATPYNFGSPFPAGPNDPDLDITSVTLASPADKLRAYVKVDKLGTPSYAPGHIFTVMFTLNAKIVRFWSGQDVSPVDSVRGPATALAAGPLSGVSYDASVIPDAVVDAVFDTKTSTVVLTVDRAPIEKIAKASLADGTAVTEVSAESTNDLVWSGQVGDDAQTKTPYTVGDNACFGPPAATVTIAAPARAVAGHTVTVTGTLGATGGKGQAGKSVQVAVGAAKATAVTDANGAFAAKLKLNVAAGTYDATATFAGDDSLQTATATAKTVVSIQPTKTTLTAAPSGSAVLLTAQLVDDLGAPVAGKTITWSVDGKAVRTSKTDAKGRATFSSAKKHAVKGTYAGDKTRYAASQAARTV